MSSYIDSFLNFIGFIDNSRPSESYLIVHRGSPCKLVIPTDAIDEIHDETKHKEYEYCCICNLNIKKTIIYPCKHRALCLTCSRLIANSGAPCPICKSKIFEIFVPYDV